MIANEPPVPITEHRSDLPPEVVRLLDAMLAQSPEDRPSARGASEALAAR